MLFMVVFFFPSSWCGGLRSFRGFWAFSWWSSLAAAPAVSLLPPSGGRLVRRLAVFVAFFSPVFYRRLGVFYRHIVLFYRHIVWFFLANVGFFS